jgi:hypothetical protein
MVMPARLECHYIEQSRGSVVEGIGPPEIGSGGFQDRVVGQV